MVLQVYSVILAALWVLSGLLFQLHGLVFQQSQDLYHLALLYWILTDVTALEKQSLFEVKEDGECEPWGSGMQGGIPLDASTAGFALIRCVLGFLPNVAYNACAVKVHVTALGA